MSYRLTIERSAQKTLSKIERTRRTRIEERITALCETPRPHGVTKLAGVNAYRFRVGDYRIVYTIEDATQTVNIVNVGHRRSIYQEVL